jgi:hypothetical protein
MGLHVKTLALGASAEDNLTQLSLTFFFSHKAMVVTQDHVHARKALYH